MKDKKFTFIQIVLIIIMIFCILVPLGKMISSVTSQDMIELFRNPKIRTALWNSLFVTLTASIVSVGIAYLLAAAVTRSNIRLKSALRVLLVIPMLVPSISQGTGLIILFGTNGLITNLFGFSGSIYGFQGIVIGAFLYAYPVAFLMFCNILTYEDGSPYEAARVLGIPPYRQFLSITLPYLKKPLISIFFAVFTMIFTDYGIPLSIGGKYITLPSVLYQEVIGQLNFSMGSAIGLILLCPAVVAFVLDMLKKEKSTRQFVAAKMTNAKHVLRDFTAAFLCIAVVIFDSLIIFSFIILAFTANYPANLSISLAHFSETFQTSGAKYLGNSIVIALAASIFGTVLAFITAYMTARFKNKGRRLLHLMTLSTLAIPGIVLGLSYSLFFSGTMIYGTLYILIIVNIVHFIHSPYLLMYDSLSALNEDLESVGSSLGISRWYMIWDVMIPQVKYTLLEMGAYFFTNSMVTISAVIFLSTTNTKPFSLTINQFEALMITECSAVVALIILMINLTVKLGIEWMKRRKEDVKYVDLQTVPHA